MRSRSRRTDLARAGEPITRSTAILSRRPLGFPAVMTPEEGMPAVLVVDDEPAIRRLVQTVLGLEGCVVNSVATGAEAVAVVHTHRPDLLVLDVHLPEMDG